ncbi:PREDICTED: F-box protein At5g62510-like [Ipomoea nil]|uniref:F-box protein At5g62510-like n=1 Tax=Ipomoea nil TaxID=35883 RepID=UPI00090111A9|nr:PREDICTED: F-box protein At5g62510-like [Ipomoea nil]
MDSPSISSTSITSLPLDILLEILTGLPPKSAVGFRCTSKFFHDLIPEPRFAFRILVSLPSKTPRALNLYSVSYSEDSHGNLRADTAQRLDVQGLVCSIDGKTCLCRESGGEAVYDLSTGRRICLPSIGWPVGYAASSFNLGVCSYSVLGFDSVLERYKVFRSVVYCDSDQGWMLNRLYVLTVGVDKTWREIDYFPFTVSTQGAVHIHGIIYLIPRQFSQPLTNLFDFFTTEESKIIAMDVATESFITSIPFPFEYPSPYLKGGQPWMKLNGGLAFINILGPQKASGTFTPWPDKIDICTLERSMEWEKQTVILPLEEKKVMGEATFMEFTTNSMGEIVFLIQRNCMTSPLILVYSFGRDVWRRFEIHAVCNYPDFYRGAVHVEDEIVNFLE